MEETDKPQDQPADFSADAVAQQQTNENAARDKECIEEFDRYYKDRDALTKAELDHEKNFDTLLVTLSTGVVGGTFLFFKDAKLPPRAFGFAIPAFILLGLCLFLALLDRLLSYFSHVRFRKILDAHHTDWKGIGAAKRATAEFEKIRWIKVLPWMKWIGLGLFAIGIVLLLPALIMSISTLTGQASSRTNSTMPATVVNVYAGDSAGAHCTADDYARKMKGFTKMSNKPPSLPSTPSIPPSEPGLPCDANQPIPPAAPRPIDTAPNPTSTPTKPSK